MSSITSKEITRFRRLIWRFYHRHGRHGLPWRETRDPYHILVSEIMLQQTQVDRVIPKYQAFIERFPSIDHLAAAPLRDVLALWSGLGYNRRARYLHEAAKQVVSEYDGSFPRNVAALQRLPGVGSYTARAVAAFAFELPDVFIETNLRTVYLHHFFPSRSAVSDAEVLPLIAVTLSRRAVRTWYYALMDYGSHLKRTTGNANRRSRHYVKQSAFRGSNRELRGLILKHLLTASLHERELPTLSKGFSSTQVTSVLRQLEHERLITKRGQYYRIVT